MEQSKSTMYERLTLSLSSIPESTFLPVHITKTIEMVNQSIKLDELDNYLSSTKITEIKSVENDISTHTNRYNKFIKSLDELNNLFSSDVDYI
ncbi:hypothetical protein AAAC51_06400 [Priestia megaterium]